MADVVVLMLPGHEPAEPPEHTCPTPTLLEQTRTVVDAIAAGHLDEWLEAILAAGHDRKRDRRGIPRTLPGSRTDFVDERDGR